MNRRTLVVFVVIVSGLALGCQTRAFLNDGGVALIGIGPFDAADAARHQALIQQCLDSATGRRAVFQFAPGDYVLSDPAGLRVPAQATLWMDGARFLLAETIATDGQAFLLDGVSGVTFRGGEIVGRRDVWAPGVNVAGIRVRGSAGDIRITELTCRDLTSNAVGVFGASEDAPIRNVSLSAVTGINCCNEYIDYLQPNKGPIAGSEREDQGTVALYYVDGWAVDACRFEGSKSDGTHFFHSHNGRFVNSCVNTSRMGGYFLEGCRYVTASGNTFRENGSRGVTIERDSRYCTLASNLIVNSGREGLWMPDVCAILVKDNVFVENGRKDDGEKDCEIRLDDSPDYETRTQDVRIEGNLFQTSAHQTAAVFAAPGVDGVLINDNTFTGARDR